MIRPVRLTREADSRLDDIFDWTFDRFGPQQAERYRARLQAAFDRLAEGTLRGRSALAEFGEWMPEWLLFVRVERHVVLFVETTEEVVVVAVLHGAMDLPRRLGE